MNLNKETEENMAKEQQNQRNEQLLKEAKRVRETALYASLDLARTVPKYLRGAYIKDALLVNAHNFEVFINTGLYKPEQITAAIEQSVGKKVDADDNS